MMRRLTMPKFNRDLVPPIILGLLVIAYAWTAARDLSDLSESLSAAAKASEPEEGRALSAPSVGFDEMDTRTLTWFGRRSEPPMEIVVSMPARRRAALPEVQPEPTEPSAVVVFPAMKLFGVFIGEKISEVIAEIDGVKQNVTVGQEISGWRLVELLQSAAVFESASGQKETVRLFRESP